MQNVEELQTWRGLDLHGEGEERIGEITELYVDAETGVPEWVTVKTGGIGSTQKFVPIADASRDGDHVDVPFARQLVEDAPSVDSDRELSHEEERRLYEHYGVAWERVDDREPLETRGDAEMTRSEEELVVDKRKRETGRARLRKYVVTDDVEVTVPVSREEIRVDRAPVSDADADDAVRG